MADYLTFPPSGLDWADGSDANGGTDTPPEYIVVDPPEADPSIGGSTFEERKDSPTLERAEQATFSHNFDLDWISGQVYINAIGRGTLFQDSNGIISQVLSATLQKQAANMATLSIVAEARSFDVPPDEFTLIVSELNPALEKHPRYAFLTASVRNTVSGAAQAASTQNKGTFENILNGIPNGSAPGAGSPYPGGLGTNQQNHDAALELLTKRRVGEDTFYLAGFTVEWSQYFWLPQFLNPGGYLEDPMAAGGLPAYFWSTDQTPNGPSIFEEMATINPNLYSSGISWFRLADFVAYERTWFKLTHRWLGAPYAHWDADIYSTTASPYPPPPVRPIS